MIYTYIMAAFLSTNIIYTIINTLIIWSYKRKESFAVITDKSEDAKILKIKMSKEYFSYHKNAYIIPPNSKMYEMKIGRKKYYRYMAGIPEPMLWWTDEKPAIHGEVLHSIIENSGLKLLNTVPMVKNMMLYILIGAALLIVIFMFNKGG